MHAYIQLLRKASSKKWPALLLFFFVYFAVPAALAAGEPVGKVDTISGTVEIERQERVQPSMAGDPVYLQDRVHTRADSSAELLFLDNSRVKIAPNTVLEITEYLFNPDEKTRDGLFTMISGKARFLVQDLQAYKEKRFRVQTQTAVVGTRDTDFLVNVRPESEIDEECKESLVEAFCVENAVVMFNRDFPDKRVVLTANMLSKVCGRNLPALPRFATPRERQGLLKGVEQIGSKREVPGASDSVARSPDEAAGGTAGIEGGLPSGAIPSITEVSLSGETGTGLTGQPDGPDGFAGGVDAITGRGLIGGPGGIIVPPAGAKPPEARPLPQPPSPPSSDSSR